MVWYIPPLSPVVDRLAETGHDGEDADNSVPAQDRGRCDEQPEAAADRVGAG
jgi:nitrate reductase beta subunit